MTIARGDLEIVLAESEAPKFSAGQRIRVSQRSPVGHYRVPSYLRDKRGVIERIIEPRGIDNEEEAFGRNAGVRLHYYRVSFSMIELWPNYAGAKGDSLRIEVFETWLEGAET